MALVTLECTMYFFNVREPAERELCMNMLEEDLTGEGTENRDGSLAKTLRMLRTRSPIEEALRQKMISFVLLPFGMGCNTA